MPIIWTMETVQKIKGELNEEAEKGEYVENGYTMRRLIDTIEAQQQEIEQLKLLQKKDGINILNVCRWWQDEFWKVPENNPCPRELKELCPAICPKVKYEAKQSVSDGKE